MLQYKRFPLPSDGAYFLVPLFYDLSSIKQHIEGYPYECKVESETIKDCMLSADEANIYYTYTSDTEFYFQEFYYSTDSNYSSINGGDFESFQRQVLFDDQVTSSYFLKGDGTFNYIEYHENNYFLELRGDSEVIKEYVWYDIKLDEFIRVLRTNSGVYEITYFKDEFYVGIKYIEGQNPEWIYNYLGTFNEAGNKEVNYTFLGGEHSATMYNLKYLDGWSYIRYETFREFYITDIEKNDIIEIYDANQIYVLNSRMSLSDLGLTLNIEVMNPSELEAKADSEVSDILDYFGIEFGDGELSNIYLDLINIEMIEGLNERDE